eukprot:Platyproteum_vivax@DN3834_c0_g1_i1.p1
MEVVNRTLTEALAEMRQMIVPVTFHSIGNAPVIKKTKYRYAGTTPVSMVSDHLANLLNVAKQTDAKSLVLYSKDVELCMEDYLGDVYKVFAGGSGPLQIKYSLGRVIN